MVLRQLHSPLITSLIISQLSHHLHVQSRTERVWYGNSELPNYPAYDSCYDEENFQPMPEFEIAFVVWDHRFVYFKTVSHLLGYISLQKRSSQSLVNFHWLTSMVVIKITKR